MDREGIRDHIDMVIWEEIDRVAQELVEDDRAGTISANCVQRIINLFEESGWVYAPSIVKKEETSG